MRFMCMWKIWFKIVCAMWYFSCQICTIVYKETVKIFCYSFFVSYFFITSNWTFGKRIILCFDFSKKGFIIFQQFLLLFSLFKIYFGSITFLIPFLTLRVNVYTSYMLLHFISFFASRVFHKGAVSSMNIFWNP